MDELIPLLDILSQSVPIDAAERDGWRISRVTGGWNNLLYRATNAEYDLAIKFAIRDNRDRAGREFQALTALRDAGLNIAPAPVLLEQNRYRLPVVVQTWVQGVVKDEPPANDEEWMHLLRHLVTIHRLTPHTVCVDLREAVVTMQSAEEGKARVRQQVALLPDMALNDELRELLRRLEEAPFVEWQSPSDVLCRVDPNITNFIRRDDRWVSVDWENAGWGDAGFEIADLMVHPAYASVEPERWDWVIAQYCRLMDTPQMEQRIRVYRQIMLVWWAVRCARYLYDIPRGNDRRLVDQPAQWQADFQNKYARYLCLAQLEF